MKFIRIIVNPNQIGGVPCIRWVSELFLFQSSFNSTYHILSLLKKRNSYPNTCKRL